MNEATFFDETMSLPAGKPKNKFLSFCERIGKRNFIIAGTVVLIGAAVWVNWVLFSSPDQPTGYDYDKAAQEQTDNTPVASNATENTENYFSSTMVSRQRARDEALEVLQNVVDNQEADESAKASAIAGMSSIADEIQKEAAIESLVTAKGYESCVAVMNGNTVSVIVSADSLEPAELAQINTIVYETTGISPRNITIMAK